MFAIKEDSASALLKEPAVIRLAAALDTARQDRAAIDPVAPALAPLGLDGAYAAQSLQTAARLSGGARIIGRKIGLTSPAVQRQLGVDQPDYGTLFDDMEYAADVEIPLSRFIQPKIEAEIAFVLERDIDLPRAGLADIISAVAYALPALEIVDSRIRDWKITLLDTVADNASSGAFVLGGSPRRLDTLDLRLCGMVLEQGGEPVSVGCGAACLGHPLNALVWLARKMASVGNPLRAGDVVLSGALGPMVPVTPGAVYEARISGLGRVAAAFGAA